MDDSFGTWVQHQRTCRRVNQVELAERAGCSVDMLRNVEANRCRLSKELRRCLFKALDSPAAEWAALEHRARYLLPPPEPASSARPAPPTLLSGVPYSGPHILHT